MGRGEDQPGDAALGGCPRSTDGTRVRPSNIASWAAVALLSAVTAAADNASVRTVHDAVGDAVVRRMDAGADGPVDPGHHHQPDIVAVRICRWQPDVPHQDLFTGSPAALGDFFRLDITFDGLVNPPGPTGCCGFPFAPFQYGNHPVFGYVEIDVDAHTDTDTGGELELPQLMYLGNAGRFGGLPVEPLLASRCARDASAFDPSIVTPPLVDRSGEDFHIALHGWEITGIQRAASTDTVFGPGDVWLVSGRLFLRARGYERFSFADTTGHPGKYSPLVRLRFAHSITDDQTTVSLVYPLTNRGSAAQTNATAIEPLDGDAANQNSILEALDDLVFSAANAPSIWRDDPAFTLIAPWRLLDEAPRVETLARYLDPLPWRITVLVGGSYTAPSNDVQFVWSDVLPDVRPGDFTGDGEIDWRDRLVFNRFIQAHDGVVGKDRDATVDCAVTLVNFGPNFSVFDVNYDGRVDAADLVGPTGTSRVPGDFDGDGDVDQTDFGVFQTCLTGLLAVAASPRCIDADLDVDHNVDADDLAILEACASGPAVPADPACWPTVISTCSAVSTDKRTTDPSTDN